MSAKSFQHVSSDTSCSSSLLESVKVLNHSINSHSFALNEGFPMLICGNIITAITEQLDDTKSHYQFKIYPVVGEHQTDGRKNEESDYVIVRLVNERTVAVFELKLHVGRSITGAAKDDLAQLFYEGKLVCKSDKNVYEKLICVYANHNDWHVFVMDYSGVLLRCKEYHSFQHLHEDIVCKLIVDLVRRID